MRTTRVFAALAFLALNAISFAQFLQVRPNATLSQESALLLLDPTVQKSVHFTSEQEASYKKAFKGFCDAQGKLVAASASDAQFDKLELSLAKTILTLVTPEQTEQLLKLGVARVGTSALVDTAIATRLGLTAEQSSKIKELIKPADAKALAIEEKLSKKLDALTTPKTAAQTEAFEKAIAKLNVEADAERLTLKQERTTIDASVLALLSEDQKSKWDALKG